MIETKVITISQLVGYIKSKLTSDYVLKNIRVQGEIGNFTNHFNGHWYFTLKDNNAMIDCAMFKGSNCGMKFIPCNGDKVIVTGSITVFEKAGRMQLIVSSMDKSGAGDFYAQFEQMKKKLAPLGYFDPQRKKKIPSYPNSISVITGANTAALQDIKITISKRWPAVELRIVPAIVQGNEAPNSIIQALKIADSQNSDVMILARGGGSVDDLWCFNDEGIATTIFNLKTPIVTGIGHEIDTTIADLVADERCATPTAAAQRVTPNLSEVLSKIDNYYETIVNCVNNRYRENTQLLDYYNNRLSTVSTNIERQYRLIDNYNSAISKSMMSYKAKADYKLMNQLGKFKESSNQFTNYIQTRFNSMNNELGKLLINKTNEISATKLYIDTMTGKNEKQLSNRLKTSQMAFVSQINLLEMASPLNILKRGYSLTYQRDKIVRSVSEIDLNENIKIQFADGIITAKSIEVKKKN